MRLQSERSARIEAGMVELLRETKEIKTHLMEYNFHMRMDTVDLSEYLPFKTDEDLKRFMKPDEEWNQRKKVSLINPQKNVLPMRMFFSGFLSSSLQYC